MQEEAELSGLWPDEAALGSAPSRIPKARGSAPAKGPKQTGASCARLQAHSGGAATAFCGEEEQGSDATAAFSPIAKKPPE